MRYVELPHTNLRSSVLGFGCSALLGRTGRTDSLRALDVALDAGINFFDTARSYGYGESESLLGEFLKGKRHSVIISTKFGIVPAKAAWWKQAIKPAARWALNLAPSGRRLIQNQVKAQFQEGMFSAKILRDSLNESLRRLKTDYVDFLFAHSAPLSILENQEVLLELERAVQLGKVRVAGISATPDVVALTLKNKPRFLKAFQFPCSMFDSSLLDMSGDAEIDGLVFIANHPFGGVARVAECRRALCSLSHNESAPAAIQYKLRDIDDRILAEVVLNSILSVPHIHVVVPAMMELRHIDSNVKAIESHRLSQEELFWVHKHWPNSSQVAGPQVQVYK
jgi:aryl-alcohol dehydrogenase-like predicted oxidoreductase